MDHDIITTAHGGGGALTSQLINEQILSRFTNETLSVLPDAASISLPSDNILFSTDSFVVTPVEFPGGNIGDLAVYGTVNDIVVSGGKPLYLSLSLILEEGLPVEILSRVLDSIKNAAEFCGVRIVTGDTKVVPKGFGDGIYINTAGIGVKYSEFSLSSKRITPGDSVLVSGCIGEHGMAVLTAREQLPLENGPVSDSASVHRLAEAVKYLGDAIKFMRDPTRGGVASVLNEIVSEESYGIILDEKDIPVSPQAKSVAEILGLELLNVACEGRMILVCDTSVEKEIIEAWRGFDEGAQCAKIGTVTDDLPGKVQLKTFMGGHRIISLPKGELLPRIC